MPPARSAKHQAHYGDHRSHFRAFTDKAQSLHSEHLHRMFYRSLPLAFDRSIWYAAPFAALGFLAVLSTKAQIVNEDALRKVELPASDGLISCLVAMPDGHTILIGYTKGAPLRTIDTSGWNVVRTIPAASWPDGPRLEVSADGRIAHAFAQPRFADGRKDDPRVAHALIDPASGKTLLDFRAKDAALSRDGLTVAQLNDEELRIVQVSDGTVLNTIRVAGATNALAYSPKSDVIAVSHRTTEALLGTVPSVRNDKKAMKSALKFRQMVSFYSTVNGSLIGTVPEVYDIVRALAFTPDGTRLLVYNSNDPSAQGSTAVRSVFAMNLMAIPGRVEQVDVDSRTPLRAGFWSQMNEPFLAVSPSGSSIALSSSEGRNKRKLLLYDLASADTQLMIDLEQKHRCDTGEVEEHDGRLAYTWLADGRLVLALGNNLGILQP